MARQRMDDLVGFERDFDGAEKKAHQDMLALFHESPLPDGELLDNLALYMNHILMGRILFATEVYRRIVGVPGVVMEFGTRWGQNLAIFANLRTLFEPTHHLRRLIGFDTFEGFPEVSEEDGDSVYARPGQLRTTEHYDRVLDRLMHVQEASKPLAHKKKYEIVRGDVRETLPAWFDENSQAIVALAYFDLDLYRPTRDCLEHVRPRLTRGSVVVLDEPNDPGFPGETVALREVFGLHRIRLERVPYLTHPSFFVYEGDGH